MLKNTKIKTWLILGFVIAVFSGCEDFLKPEDESNLEKTDEIILNTFITQGPEDGSVLLFHSSPLFKWKGEVYPGYVAGFSWELEKDGELFEQSDGYSMESSKTFEKLENGSYIFTAKAMDDQDSVDLTPAVLNFTVKASDATAPVIRFTASPKDSSYRAPGDHIVFEWTAEDESVFGSVVGYSYRLDGTGNSATDWTDFDINTTTAVYSNLELGIYDFQVKALDNSGLVSSPVSVRITVKEPSILVVDHYIPGDHPFLNELNTDKVMANILRDWSVKEWDVDELGLPSPADLADYTTVIWYADNWPADFIDFATGDVENPIDDFLDAGGNLWLIGSEIIYCYYWEGDTLGFDDGHFLKDYLHLEDGYDADAGEFTGLEELADPVEGFTKIGIPGLATGGDWPDQLVPVAPAIPIYDLGGSDAGTTAGILYDGDDHKVVFWSVNFAFVATNGNHLTLDPVDVYPVANHILANIFGE